MGADARLTGRAVWETVTFLLYGFVFIDSEREALLRLRAEGAIDDDVMRSLERELDLEEQRMDA